MKKSNIDAIINKKCAPGRQYIDESCLQLKDLKKIAINYNKITNKNKININLPKQELVKKLEHLNSYQHEIMPILNFVASKPDPEKIRMFLTRNEEQDEYRKQSFATTFPEWNAILRSHYK